MQAAGRADGQVGSEARRRSIRPTSRCVCLPACHRRGATILTANLRYVFAIEVASCHYWPRTKRIVCAVKGVRSNVLQTIERINHGE